MSPQDRLAYAARAEAELRESQRAADMAAALEHRKRAGRYFDCLRRGVIDPDLG